MQSTAHTRLVTKQQFKRVIATLNLRASDGDMELVCNKFQVRPRPLAHHTLLVSTCERHTCELLLLLVHRIRCRRTA